MKAHLYFDYSMVAFFALVIFSNISYCEILTNNPNYGEDLEILVEPFNYPNDSAVVISPSANRAIVPLENGQGKIKMSESGLWRIEYQDQKSEIRVLPTLSHKSQNEPQITQFTWVGAIFIVLFFVVVLAGTITLFSKIVSESNKQIQFTKVCDENSCVLNFDSGAHNLQNVSLFLNSKKIAGAKKMAEFERLQLKLDISFVCSCCYATFFENSKKFKISLQSTQKKDKQTIDFLQNSHTHAQKEKAVKIKLARL